MWIDAEKNLHTAAVPAPREYLRTEVLRVLDGLTDAQVAILKVALDDIEVDIADAVDREEFEPAGRGEQIPQFISYLMELSEDDGVPEICQELLRVPVEWRLDALYLVVDVVDSR